MKKSEKPAGRSSDQELEFPVWTGMDDTSGRITPAAAFRLCENYPLQIAKTRPDWLDDMAQQPVAPFESVPGMQMPIDEHGPKSIELWLDKAREPEPVGRKPVQSMGENRRMRKCRGTFAFRQGAGHCPALCVDRIAKVVETR